MPGGGPMQTLSSAIRTCIASASAVECTATAADAHLATGADHAKGDLAHGLRSESCRTSDRPYSITIKGAPNSTGAPSSTRMRFTVPDFGARVSGSWSSSLRRCRRVWPSLTLCALLDEFRCRRRVRAQGKRCPPWAKRRHREAKPDRRICRTRMLPVPPRPPRGRAPLATLRAWQGPVATGHLNHLYGCSIGVYPAYAHIERYRHRDSPA